MGGAVGVFGRAETPGSRSSNEELLFHHDGVYSWAQSDFEDRDIVHAEVYHARIRAPHGRLVPWPKNITHGLVYRRI